MPNHPLGNRRATLPFALAAVLAFPLALLPPDAENVALLWLAAVLTAVVGVAVAKVPWDDVPPAWRLGPALLYLVVVGLLRHAEGGATSGYASLVTLPLFWVALYGRRIDVAVVTAGIGATLAAPIVFVGAPAYPPAEWRRLLLWIVIAPAIGGAVHRLVQQVQRSNLSLAEASRTDPLTGLPNRRGWADIIERAAARAQRDRSSGCIAILDIDHFKRFNDTYGHDAGDALLVESAAAWGASLRGVDALARWGGEEFVVLLSDASLDKAQVSLDRLRSATPRGQTVSVGVTTWPPGEPVADAIHRADAALYRAKEAGRDRVVPG